MLKKLLIVMSIVFEYYSIKAQSFIVGDIVSTTITYVNIKDTIITQAAPKNNFDIDFDGFMDLNFCRVNWSGSPANSGGSFTVGQSDTLLPFRIQFVCTGNKSIADTLEPGSIIDNTLNWNTKARDVYLYYWDHWALPFPGYTNTFGVFYRPNAYIGFRKITPNDTLYGWFLIDNATKMRSYALNKVLNLGVEDHSTKQNDFNIYPNPSNCNLTIEAPQKSLIEISNIQGQIIMQQKLLQEKSEINICGLLKGIYILRINNNGETRVTKFIKE